MGCRHSKFAEKNRHSESLTIDDKGPAVNEAESMNDNLSIADGKVPYLSIEETPSPELSNEQKELIIETWKMLVENISSVGVITFMSLFETHPDVQDVFMPFKGMSKEELQHSRQLRAHGLRVMGFVQKVVSRLDEPEKSEQLLEELGRNHIKYGAKADYVDQSMVRGVLVFEKKPNGNTWVINERELNGEIRMASIVNLAQLEERRTRNSEVAGSKLMVPFFHSVSFQKSILCTLLYFALINKYSAI